MRGVAHLKRTVLEAGILMGSLVLGLIPLRACRLETAKVPRPAMLMEPLSLISPETTAMKLCRALLA
jgi:hypothetical protein